MNLHDPQQNRFALVREMLETPDLIAALDFQAATDAAAVIRETGRLFLTGEGSSRIFPAKNLIAEILRLGVPVAAATDGARQAHEYDLSKFVVFGASNSGKTKELISLFTRLSQQGHQQRFGLSANSPCTLETVSNRCYTLKCGKEDAVAATKSVVEQALFYRSLIVGWEPSSPLLTNRQEAAAKAQQVLEAEIDPVLIQKIAKAPTVYFAGRNNGVAAFPQAPVPVVQKLIIFPDGENFTSSHSRPSALSDFGLPWREVKDSLGSCLLNIAHFGVTRRRA